MKCTHCNKNDLTKIDIREIFDVGGDGYLREHNYIEVYLCDECGHIEFFDKRPIDRKIEKERIQTEEKRIRDFYNEKLKVVYAQKEEIENSVEFKELNEKLVEINKQLESLDITIRQQQQLQMEADEIKSRIKNYKIKLDKINSEINKILGQKTSELNDLNNTQKFSIFK